MGTKPDLTIPNGYKQTDVGIIPEDWDITPLGELTEKVGSGITPTGGEKVYKTHGRPFLRSQNIGWGNLLMDDIAFIDDEIHSTFKATEIKEGDVFLNITGASIGRSVVADDRVISGNVNQHVCIIRTIKQELNPKFLNAYLLSKSGQKQIDSFQAGGNRQGLNFGQIKTFQIPVPPTEREQQAIAEVLSDVDALVTSLDRLIAKKRNLKQGAMQLLLTGKKRLAGFSGEWETKKLGEIAHIKTGKKNNEDKVENGLFPFFVRSQTVERINSYSFDGEAILVPGEGGIGSIYHYINGKFDYHQRVYKISNFSEEVCGKYVYFCMLQTFNEQAMKNSVKATVDSLRLPTFQEFEFLSPHTFDEQQAIARILSDMDADIAALEQRRDKYKAIKQGMMQELLTGKTRLS